MQRYKANSDKARLEGLRDQHIGTQIRIGTLEMNCKTDPQIPQLCRLIDRINKKKKLLVEGDADGKV